MIYVCNNTYNLKLLLQITNKIYQEKLEELDALQKKCAKHISHQRYRLGIISSNLEG